jgi:hypothetical protein
MYLVWALSIPVVLYLLRFIFKSIRKPQIVNNTGKYYLVRDLFLKISGFEYLIVAVVCFALYLGFWAYKIDFSIADWSDWKTYLVILPQFITLIAIICLFYVRYFNFRKPFLK